MATCVSCPLCLHQSFSQLGDLISALLSFIQRPLHCPLCTYVADCPSSLKLHLPVHLNLPNVKTPPTKVERDRYVCKQCGAFQSNDILQLKIHVEAEHPERKFLCIHCCKQFKAQASLTLHLRMAHHIASTVGREHQCLFCSKKFASLGRKQAHERLHQSEPHSLVQSPSNECTQTAATQDETKSSFNCPICDKTFKKEQYLQQHSRTHEAKRWECSVCHKLFTTKEYLRKHSRLHTGETPYSCEQCGKTFTFQQSYHKHLLYHSDERPYSCDQCNKRFKELSTLHNHQRIHTGEKPYSCDTCGKAFRQRVSYVVHRRIHTGALPYVCSGCGKSFRYKVSQRTHKCDANRSDTDTNMIRNRPDWLERLVTAQQQLTTIGNETVLIDPDPATTMGDVPQNMDVIEDGPIPFQHDIQQPATTLESKNLYESDSSLDLSQLTLSLDSDLIFPG